MQLLFDSIQQPQIQWPEVRPLSDWRIESGKWTRGAVLQFKRYTLYREGWDHDHCECCWAKFAESEGPDVLTEGYATEDNYRWICPTCFHELKDVMGWKLG